MDVFAFPVLSVILFVPIVAGVLILFMNGEQRDLIRGVAIAAAAIVLFLSAAVYVGYSSATANVAATQDSIVNGEGLLPDSPGTEMFKSGLAFEERYDWITSLGISYHVGIDGLNAPMVLLTGLVAVAGVLISWRIEDRTREFMAFFMLLVAGVYGVFIALDMFTLFFFYELAIFPMYLLIATWGWVQTRQYAAMKLTLYILIGSVVALVGVIAMVFAAQSYFQSADGAQVLQSAINAGIVAPNSTAFNFDMVNLTLAAEHGALRYCSVMPGSTR